ncbi:hypothetical protein DXG03_002389 [Asterophora parasitica]|uniref:Carbohydrate-binding module family 19 domain-containing protein n=1 Tax=Asterophora parasitica TaxID=117018 RepID=A0A9P7G4G2_9AGAR|nr:hypothetical protein DXG03_002389 [Asterophora parasitica]
MSPRISTALFLLALSAVLAPVRSAPTFFTPRHEGHDDASAAPAEATDLQHENAVKAQKLNAASKNVKVTDACQGNEIQCIDGAFAMCNFGKWALTECSGAGLRCYNLPLVNKAGVTSSCTTEADAVARFEAAGVTGGPGGSTSTSTDDDEDCDDDDEHEGDEDCNDEDDHPGKASSTLVSEPIVVTVTQTVTPSPTATVVLVAGKGTAAAAPFSANAGGYYGYKRQLQQESPADTPVTNSTVIATPTVLPSNSVVTQTVNTIPSSTVLQTTSNALPTTISSSLPISTGVVLGADGIRTVTVVSTSTVTVCGASTIAPTPTPVSTVIDLPKSTSTFTFVTTITPSVTTITSSVTPGSSSAVLSSIPASSSTPAATISFSTPTAPTPAPENGGSASSSINISEQITAAI